MKTLITVWSWSALFVYAIKSGHLGVEIYQKKFKDSHEKSANTQDLMTDEKWDILNTRKDSYFIYMNKQVARILL